ncbi:TetR/AcrR family transcriptional regulator [Glaciecola sp. KUL10]|uniref:TetR/AcrR family transcriptional regulator n=1 Tax=Glaciecola sp. (strain KUL10) TaxID=2161813 RepID=UPI000D7868BF|nr:TetR/AcrR family transcriptional regulator [Glaciecola sp. KUL10]GBL05159.1 TetR family transcriptional regulator [Glaciecola sp. KUL10]
MSKKLALLQIAEQKVRIGGYNNFSFRELADEIGIKSASVHYHFPTKADLGAELAKNYTESFLESLGDPKILHQNAIDPVKAYVEKFKTALIKDQKMCLCGLLGAEIDGLPDKVKTETKRFFERNINWLTQAHIVNGAVNNKEAADKAIHTLSLLEGALMISKTLDDQSVFESALSQTNAF